jgi:hypothetical protein
VAPLYATTLGTFDAGSKGRSTPSLLMKFKRRLVLVSQRNQYDAASPTSVGSGPSRV